MCGIRLTVPPIYSKILSKFPQKLSFCFAYGSGVKSQLQNAKPGMIDFVYCVKNADKWHEENLKINSNHYSFLKFFGHNIISKFQENSGAKVYFNTLVNIDDVMIKYGVISQKDLITDLLEWSDLYLAGRLHKPVEIVRKTTNSELQTALQLNLQSAVHAALLLLPESFTEFDFYHTICNLSYKGDFRMTFGENKNKVSNIVKPQISGFRNLYKPLIKSLHDYVEFPAIVWEENNLKNNALSKENQSSADLLHSDGLCCKQDVSPLAKLHHLNQLPRWPQKAITRFWNRDTVAQDTEDVLRAIAYDPDCGAIVEQCINDIVWRSSVRQSLKGILTAGVMKMNMPYPLSDEESSDSDSGVRFKTANTRDKFKASSSSTPYNIKSDKSDNKHSLYKSSHRESKSKSSVKYRYETSSSRRKEDRYSRRSSGSEKSYSSNHETSRCTIDDKINSRRKRHDDSHCSKEKEKIKRKLSPQRKKITKTDNNSSRQDDSIAFGPSLPTKNINANKELKPEVQKTEVSQISKGLSKNKTVDSEKQEIESCIGPALPQKLANDISKKDNPQMELNFNESEVSIASSSKIDSIQNENQQNYFGPSLPPKTEEIIVTDSENVYGPTIPLHLKTSESATPTSSCKNKEKKKDNASETLNTKCKILGPFIPDHLRVNIANESDNTLDTSNEVKGNDSDSEDCIIGPLPAQQSLNTELEERALQMKLDLLNKTDDKSASREEWMLELPEIRSVAQALGPRKFRTKEMPDLSDRSMWTETAKDKANNKASAKNDIKLEANLKNLREKDLIQEKIVEKQKKSKRNKSLIDLHTEELQKKKVKDDSITEERRPFSRDIDLKINRFDDAQTKAIIKKARLLDNKFASGQSKFL